MINGQNQIKLDHSNNFQANSYLSFAQSHMSMKNLEPVYERASEQRTTIKEPKISEFSSNESTPRIEEEEIVVNTLQGGYSEAIKKSFHDKNLN